MRRVSNFRVLSDRSGRMLPHQNRSRNICSTSARSPFWLTEKLGRISHPNLCRALRLNDTQKHPSPSAYPVRYNPISTLPPRKRSRRVMSAVLCERRDHLPLWYQWCQGSVVTGPANVLWRASHGITLSSASCPCEARLQRGLHRYQPVRAGLLMLTRQGISLP